ncbi:MAG: NUDIX hydrolase N-terminal domain-containing protein [Defluviitaleaceae bacterium]|nr:NUDIX hydrolase N-terminal domain-containing protein [Defluviitaleaceae bacterium]
MQAIAQIGLTYTKDVFDMERYARMREIAAEIMAAKSGLDTAVVQNLFCNEVGYQTPKLDTRAAIFKGGKILLVKERERWAMPGGWVDVLETVGVNSIKEVKEETGFDARPLRLIALLDKKRQNNPSLPYGAITAFVLCELISESGFIKNNETTDAAWFSLSDLPELATEKNSAEQIEMCFRANDDANWVVLFD